MYLTLAAGRVRVQPLTAGEAVLRVCGGRGLHSSTSQLNLRNFRNASLPPELNLSTFGTHPRVHLGYMGGGK